jgi:methyltransferase (TIGR00027 family)
MISGQPSRTAFAAARHRAVHQTAEQGGIFLDPLAVRILGDGGTPDRAGADWLADRPIRLFIALRSRFAQDELRAALARGVRQIVILGAGLDTTAYRHERAKRVRVFEVDHPATQAWKRGRLRDVGIEPPPELCFVAVDFEHESLGLALDRYGFDGAAASLFLWLGVVPYLTREAIVATFSLIGTMPGGGAVVFDYAAHAAGLSGDAQRAREARQARVAAMGEPWISLFDPADVHAMLLVAGFHHVEDCEAIDLAARYACGSPDFPRGRGGHIVHAATDAA